MTGQRFGRLLVLHRVPRRPKARGPALWYCQCDCGAIAVIGGSALRTGFTKSCGCLRRDVTIARNKQTAADRRAARL